MRALCWHRKGDVRVDTVPDPTFQHPRDAVIKITLAPFVDPICIFTPDTSPRWKVPTFSGTDIWEKSSPWDRR
jgi:hypothetical protein